MKLYFFEKEISFAYIFIRFWLNFYCDNHELQFEVCNKFEDINIFKMMTEKMIQIIIKGKFVQKMYHEVPSLYDLLSFVEHER